MSEYINLEDDEDNENNSEEELTPLDEVFDSLKELFEIRGDLDDAFESVVNELYSVFEAKETSFLEEIHRLEEENKKLEKNNIALTQILHNLKIGNIQNN